MFITKLEVACCVAKKQNQYAGKTFVILVGTFFTVMTMVALLIGVATSGFNI